MYNFAIPSIDLQAIGPVLVVMVTGLLALIIELIIPKRQGLLTSVSVFGLAIAAFLTMPLFDREDEVIGAMVVADRFGAVTQVLLVLSCAVTLLFSSGYLREKRIAFGEFYALILWSTGGAMLMATTRNLLVLFLGLEVLSIALYVLAGMSRSEQKSEESALKYFLLGAFASGFFLYGIAMLYGGSGNLNLDEIRHACLSLTDANRGLIVFGTGLLLVGLCFKSGFVPFHQWTPDVYQGAPTNVTAFMAASSKIAAIAALYRVLDATATIKAYWMPVLIVVAILTMTVGNLVALAQKDVKRVLGYSSIAHAGYILVAVLAHAQMPKQIGFGTVIYYLLSYSLMTIGTFAVISMVAKSGKERTEYSDLHGLWKRQPIAAAALILFIASLIGIPITSGFVGKLLVFQNALQSGLTGLAVVLAINSVISVAYYLGIARAAFVEEEGSSETQSSNMNTGLAATLAICSLAVVLLGILNAPVIDWITGNGAGAQAQRQSTEILVAKADR